MEKLIKARKDHKCNYCDQTIKKGEVYEYIECRGPKYAPSEDPEYDGPQIGIFYDKFRKHHPLMNCHWPQQCKQGNHSIVEYLDTNPESDSCGQEFIYCENCGTPKQDL